MYLLFDRQTRKLLEEGDYSRKCVLMLKYLSIQEKEQPAIVG